MSNPVNPPGPKPMAGLQKPTTASPLPVTPKAPLGPSAAIPRSSPPPPPSPPVPTAKPLPFATPKGIDPPIVVGVPTGDNPILPTQVAKHAQMAAKHAAFAAKTLEEIKESQKAKTPVVPRPFKMPGSDTLERLINNAKTRDPVLGANFRVRSRFQKLLDSVENSPSDVVDWGENTLRVLRQASSEQVLNARRLQEIDANRWIEEAKNLATKRQSLMDRILHGNETLEFYEKNLTRISQELKAVADKVRQERKKAEPEIETLAIEVLVMQSSLSVMTEDTYLKVADDRARTLISGQQTAMLCVNMMKQTEQVALEAIALVSNVLNVTIPAWKMSRP